LQGHKHPVGLCPEMPGQFGLETTTQRHLLVAYPIRTAPGLSRVVNHSISARYASRSTSVPKTTGVTPRSRRAGVFGLSIAVHS
jgi:hypothetical protein